MVNLTDTGKEYIRYLAADIIQAAAIKQLREEYPENMAYVYAGRQGNKDERAKPALVKAGLVTNASRYDARLTEAGKELAEELFGEELRALY